MELFDLLVDVKCTAVRETRLSLVFKSTAQSDDSILSTIQSNSQQNDHVNAAMVTQEVSFSWNLEVSGTLPPPNDRSGRRRDGTPMDGWKSQPPEAPKVQRQINEVNPVEYPTSSALLPGPLFFLHSFATSALMRDEHV